jgi:hypothetical protein
MSLPQACIVLQDVVAKKMIEREISGVRGGISGNSEVEQKLPKLFTYIQSSFESTGCPILRDIFAVMW